MRRHLAIALAALLLVAGTAAALKYDDWYAIPRARKPVVAHLSDPDSAKFRNDRIAKSGYLCGEINAKNRMGGYIGFKKFIAGTGERNYIEGDGLLSTPSPSDQEMLSRVARDFDEQRLKWKMDGVNLPEQSESEREAAIRERFFQAKWTDLCEV